MLVVRKAEGQQEPRVSCRVRSAYRPWRRMRPMKTHFSFPKTFCAIAGLAALGAIAPAHAQQVVEEIIVEGHQGKLPDNVKRAATAVSYSDLDLSTDWGRRELRKRVSLTARYLCEKLGESDHSSGVVPSCRDAAVRDTMRRVGTVEA